ncbi:MAG: alpha-amylase family glycosyl hydrolase [Candidatus Thorarchaeota archaeon]
MKEHQILFEINTRVWLYNLRIELGEEITLLKIPEEYWLEFVENGFDWIWLMGVWKHSPLTMEDLKRHPGLKKEFTTALPDWKPADVIGSPYSIIEYELNPMLGEPDDLKILKKKLNKMGVKLMVDFVPNHFGNASPLVRSQPDLFISLLEKPNEILSLFSKVETDLGSRWIAFGKDPFFPPWDDTFQINYFNPDTRKYMIDILFQIADQSDGIRCDMAMLCLNEIICRTWGWYFKEKSIKQPQTEFWKEAITRIKSVHPKFVFLAEVYWDLNWQLQQLGFNYTYDKRLYDRLIQSTPPYIRGHFLADLDYQRHSLRFIENHDERRSIELFGKEKSIAAAVISGTIPGLCLYHQGQFEGYKLKIPIQLRQKAFEQSNKEIQQFYDHLLRFTTHDVFKEGEWTLINTSEAWKGNNSWQNVLSWQWVDKKTGEMRLIVVNYASNQSQGRVFPILLKSLQKKKDLELKDFLTKEEYTRNVEMINSQGLYVDLQPYQSHLFIVK